MKLLAQNITTYSIGSALLLTAAVAQAEIFQMNPILVSTDALHPSQTVKKDVKASLNDARTVSEVNGGVLQNLNSINKLDGMRYQATGLINQPWNGDRFGGGTKIRTFGDWGAAESIDGLPAYRTADSDSNGFSNTTIPSIAVENMQVRKGGHGVEYGSGTDGGVLQTNIKSGRSYKNHSALSMDVSNLGEAQLQGEAADSSEQWDYYVAGKYFQGDYNKEPDNLNEQKIYGGVGKFGWNASDQTRAELLLVVDRNKPDIIRGGQVQSIRMQTQSAAVTVDHRLSDEGGLEVGLVVGDSRTQWPARNRDRSIDNQIGFINYFHSQALSNSIQYDGSIGFEYKRTNAKRDDKWNNTFNDYAVKLRNGFTVDENFMIAAGLRYTWFSNDIQLNGVTQPDTLKTDGVFSYELSAAYNVFSQTRLRASLSSGYNRFISKYGNFGSDALNTVGAGDEVVESDTVELGFEQSFDLGRFDVAVYQTTQDNVPRRNSGAIESMTVEQSGLEAELNVFLSDSLGVAAGYMHIFDVEATRANGTKVNGNIFWDGQTASVPKDQVNLRANYSVSDTVQLWSAAYYSGGYESVDAVGTIVEREGFSRVDLGASWQATSSLLLRFRGENVTNEKDFGQSVVGVPVSDDGKVGRVFWIGADYKF